MEYRAPGWKYLTKVNRVLVEDELEMLEVMNNYKAKRKFTIKNIHGEHIYYAVEDSNFMSKICCGRLRPFDIVILDKYQNEMIHLYRPLDCIYCCFPCCLQTMEVTAPPHTLVGTIQQEWSISKSSFLVLGPSGETLLRIHGPKFSRGLFGNVTFKVLTADGETQIGRISKQWYGVARDMFPNADYFGVSFPTNLDIRLKAVVIGACFLINILFYERICRDFR